MPRPTRTLLDKIVDIMLEADQKHHMYRSFPPGALKPDGYQCTGCGEVFTSDDARKRHRIVAIVHAFVDFMVERRDR